MSFLHHFDRLRRIDGFIRRKATDAPAKFACRLNISRATLFRDIDELRSYGAKIAYDKERQTYYYEELFELRI